MTTVKGDRSNRIRVLSRTENRRLTNKHGGPGILRTKYASQPSNTHKTLPSAAAITGATDATESDDTNRLPITCDDCHKQKGVYIVNEGKLLLPGGDCVRFPFVIQCECGHNVKWRKTPPTAERLRKRASMPRLTR